ncbi:ubiquitin conjugating enzyme [Aspergillus nomiae NRRL 13137]|uniref:Ubiquitin conjugating enzyme n=1 Tax=Aspergillus nomiae NRRL (strain ATCC 15546 / NRRL 13137 / CBS 260.88 / M93) TaxID=1509407 RepID=A0A0L1IWS3_ASPN3|nr:ubiquitin conjugating enzyme [Aspergillus nomiae NRRL 13137]KNG83643.1 ubiquitin conjugating enzyme [Aspergillus nomiae NRRL 13137]
MPRKEFQRDLIQASVPGRFPRLEGVRAGDEHGSVLYTYMVPFSNETFDFQTSVLDTHDYPGHHTYFTFAASDNVPDDVSKAIEQLQPTVARLAIGPFLECISNSIDNTLLGVGSSLDSFHEDPSESEIFSGDDDMDFDVDSDAQLAPPTDKAKVMKQIRSDMGTVKKAGYRVGFLGELTECLIVSVSCRIGKLGISKVAMQAWNVRPSQYLVLLLRYPLGYCNLDEVIEKSGPKTPRIQMHVGLCDSYKPSSTSALQAFLSTDAETPGNTKKVEPELQSFFIGDSLDTLLNTHFIALVRYRLQYGFTWTGSELFLKNSQSTSPDSEEVTRGVYFVPDSWNAATPRFLRADHICEGRTPLSLPLSAIQFTLRRFVKCTEFCLNCFCKVEAGFEALMPYVCSNSLCLYQYMRLGMGPSLEWEIISQPYVVDMLVSFTYARAMAGYLEDFPTGIGMNVPYSANTNTQLVYHGQLNQSTMVLDARDMPDLRVGEWILIVPSGAHIRHGRPQWHCRVQDADFPSSIRLSPPVIRWTPDGQDVKLEGSGAVQFMRYNGCFDDLPDSAKCESIIMLLDTLPNVNSMRSFISSHSNGSSKRALASWCDRISPAGLYVLRWIVASNRSCIRYEDDPEHRIPHLNGHAQFRLAQGAPDKEQRFVSAVKSFSSSHNPEYPTLFAWHGSPLSNWHSILREGFHFRTIAHGRSRGDGVYMSRHFGYSLSYASSHHLNKAWPNSTLNIDRALSLNEIVNAPEQFVFSGEHYVVDKLDWIQPRYLIVGHKSASLIMGDTRLEPSMTYTQDPSYEASGPTGRALTLPISAVSSHWSRQHAETTPRNTREGQDSHDVMPMADDDLDSVVTFTDDDWLLETDGVGSTDTNDEATKEVFHDLSKTDFRPGRLEESTLQLLGPPKYATPMATKSLQRHLQATLKVQEREPLYALGWYIDPNLVNNVYQWIVQLHSFEPSLPLSQDLEVAGMTSIVMELRFPPQFPMSPPFVRIIRPRFLPFSQGGGGHVTAGGAMCMELLTGSGWSPVSSIESVLLQVRMALTSTDPVPARLDQRRTQDYAVGEAVAAYTRVCQLHGWKVPDDLQQVSW